MGEMKLAKLSDRMGKIDFCMLGTRRENGATAARPMSNNGDVEYDGDSWFFSDGNTAKVREIEREPAVSLTFTEGSSLLGAPGLFVAIEGEASLVRDKAEFEKHWVPDLERWFENGIDTPGLVLIKVRARRIRYWDGERDGEIKV